MKVTSVLLSLIFVLSFSLKTIAEDIAPSTFTKSLDDDEDKISEQQTRCEIIKMLVVNKVYNVDCFKSYNHYGPTSISSSLKLKANVKIANYNLLHPGTSKTLFKDFGLIAKIINQYDIVSGLELLNTVGRDEQNNKSVVDFLENSPNLMDKLKLERSKLQDPKKINEINVKIAKLKNDTYKAYDLYRLPGYLKVLVELKKIDPSWSLVISPRGDSALVGSVEELTGFYYRASVALPTVNPHCKEYNEEASILPFACFINLTEEFMGRSLIEHFSRRPFMASFKVGSSKINLISSHVVFTYSGDEEAEKDLMRKTFGVDDYKKLGTGINGSNFARFAEVKNTIDFMERFKKKYNDKKIMFLADMNLVSKNAFWPQIFKSFPSYELLVSEASTVSPPKFLASGNETEGVANDYDHFILDKSVFSNCDNGSVYNYFKNNIFKDVEAKYIIRQEVVGFKVKSLDDFLFNDLRVATIPFANQDDIGILEGDIPPVEDPATIKLDYPITPAAQSKMDKFVSNVEKYFLSLKTIKKNEVVQEDFQIKERLDGLRRRVFLRQLTNPFYHRYMQEVLSDHFPAALTCQF